MRTGLVLGKFAPLHRGHQLLIETACQENERVVVIIYDSPEVTSIPLPVRRSWIETLYPAVHLIEAWDGPNEVGDRPEITRMHDDYLREILADETIDAFYSSEFYGEHVSRALNAMDRRIDPDRIRLPVSGTAIRENAFANRDFIDPIVYRDLITKIVFVGAPSTGKTTLASKLAEEWDTVWMPEFGREYWELHQQERRLTEEQLVEIAEGHRQREEDIFLRANQFAFIDTDATTTRMFSLYYHGRVDDRLEALANQVRERYDVFFLCENDIPYDNTWDRSGEVNRQVMQQKIKADLLSRRIPFISLFGTLEKRIATVRRVLKQFDRFSSFGNHLLQINEADDSLD